MKIDSKKNYRVKRYNTVQIDSDYGILPGADVKRILKGCTYECFPWETEGMWFSKSGRFGYTVQEVES